MVLLNYGRTTIKTDTSRLSKRQCNTMSCVVLCCMLKGSVVVYRVISQKSKIQMNSPDMALKNWFTVFHIVNVTAIHLIWPCKWTMFNNVDCTQSSRSLVSKSPPIDAFCTTRLTLHICLRLQTPLLILCSDAFKDCQICVSQNNHVTPATEKSRN